MQCPLMQNMLYSIDAELERILAQRSRNERAE